MWWWRWYSSEEMSALSTSSVYVYNGCLAWYDVLLNPRIYHSSVEWLIADVTDVSTLHKLSVFHAWVIVRLTLRYTTPHMRCRDRRYECDGGITTDHTVLPAIHALGMCHSAFTPSRSASPNFGWYSFPVPQRVGGWVCASRSIEVRKKTGQTDRWTGDRQLHYAYC